jgi:hypothetical protein
MSLDLTSKQVQIVLAGLEMYKKEVKKMLKKNDELKVSEKEVKQTFLEVESLIGKVMED